MKRRGCQPCWVKESGDQVNLRRVKFSDTSLAEAFLQNAIDRNPEILPVEELDESYGPLISLGQEIDNIDNLYISPSGRLTLAETKLWRNPESTRTVIAQILDYATRISSWSYEELESNARKATGDAPIGSQSLYEFVKSSSPCDIPPEQDFVDAVQRTLRTCRFMLLIVGDGIRENLEAMMSAIHMHPEKLFTFGLIELQIFQEISRPGEYLVVPQILANSTEVVRSVVRVETSGTGTAKVSVELEETESKRSRSGGVSARRTLSKDEFLSEISDNETKAIFTDLMTISDDLGAELTWGASSVSVKLPDPSGSGQKFTLFVMTTKGEIYTGWLGGQLERAGFQEKLGHEFVSNICSIFTGIEPSIKDPGSLSRNLSAKEVLENQDIFVDTLRAFIDKITQSD